MKFRFVIIFFTYTFLPQIYCLYPRESAYRETKILDGIWNFKICSQDDQNIGFREKWNLYSSLKDTGDVIPMPVPSSFNDITQNKTIRDYLGWSWYENFFYVPQRWENGNRIVLRFGSAHYFTIVYMNGHFVMNHTGGHLPFEADITSYLNFSHVNKITVALNNTLSDKTIPQGSKTFKSDHDGPYPPGFFVQGTQFDFFNYAGIHRTVVLYATPQVFIDDIIIKTETENTTGYVSYKISVSNTFKSKSIEPECFVAIIDKKKHTVSNQKGCTNNVTIKDAKFWWPYGMHKDPGYLYTLIVHIQWKNIIDEYFLPFGIRSVKVTDEKFIINGKSVYFIGFGKHEDSNIRGKGVDLPLIIKDFNLIKWIGANSFRTSHYPYTDEIMDQADEQGILVIDECPAVGLKSFGNELLQLHKNILTELINRDKNHPSVVAWSVANEPSSAKDSANKYFREIVSHVKSLDVTRPVTAALNADYRKDNAGKYLDYVMLNHYISWYSDTGSTEVIKPLLIDYMSKAHEVYKKPIMMSEYGGGSIAGLHMEALNILRKKKFRIVLERMQTTAKECLFSFAVDCIYWTDPPFVFTEDYQTELMMHHHEAFDILRGKGFFIGEHIWNFADFLTIQQVTRVVGNKKGIFTRERQPKASARVLKCRYHKILNYTIQGSLAYCPMIKNSYGKECYVL